MKGLKLPVGVGPNGGAALIEGDVNDSKIISIALGSGDSEHAFQQDLSLDQDMVFDLNDPTLRARILRRVERIFELFRRQKRFKLNKRDITWDESSAEQELYMNIKYINLESDEENELTKVFTSSI